ALVPVNDLVPSWKGSTQDLEAALEHLGQTKPPVVEVQTLLVNGELENYAGLTSDALAQTRGRGARLREMAAHGKTKIIDTPWIMIPLAALAAAVAFYFTRQSSVKDMAAREEDLAKKFQKGMETELKKLERNEKNLRLNITSLDYQVRVRRAADNIDAGD